MIRMHIYYLLSALVLFPTAVSGHACLIHPPSRQWYAHTEGKSAGQQENERLGVPKPEYNQYGYQAGGYTWGPCGMLRAGDTEKDYTNNYVDAFGNDVPWKTQATYEENGLIEIETHITANHRGHYEFRVCMNVHNPTQECFDKNLLTFVEDVYEGEEAVHDPNYPERGYTNPNAEYVKHKYMLPPGISGDQVLLQWQWISTLGCAPRGYDEVEWPESWNMGTWWGNLCDLKYPGVYDDTGNLVPSDGNTPQHYWQCSEISIKSSGPTTPISSAPVTAPVSSAPVLTTPAPIVSTHAPTTPVTNAPIVEVTNAPVVGGTSCFSNNWKTCNLDGVAASCNALFLSSGETELSCFTLWSDSCSDGTCCGGANCVEDGYGGSMCVPHCQPTCHSAPGTNQAECSDKTFDECYRMIDFEGKCEWACDT